MKNRSQNYDERTKFMQDLKRKINALSFMKPGTTHVFNVHAKYGNYQIIISAPSSAEKTDQSSVEIKGEVHHLFLSEQGIQTTPTREQINQNLKGMLILQGLKVDFKNSKRDEESPNMELMIQDVKPQEIINMAGEHGKEIYKHAMDDGIIQKDTYKLIQKDILQALKKHEINEEMPEETQ